MPKTKLSAHVQRALEADLAPNPVTAAATTASLKKSLPTLLQTLEALGRAQQMQFGGTTVWRA